MAIKTSTKIAEVVLNNHPGLQIFVQQHEPSKHNVCCVCGREFHSDHWAYVMREDFEPGSVFEKPEPQKWSYWDTCSNTCWEKLEIKFSRLIELLPQKAANITTLTKAFDNAMRIARVPGQSR